MKKISLIILTLLMLLGCSPKVNVDYGNSEIYTGITTAEMGFGFEIKIVKQDNYEYPFLVRIMYGPYEYVKEDF